MPWGITTFHRMDAFVPSRQEFYLNLRRGSNPGYALATICEEPLPLPRYCGAGDTHTVGSATRPNEWSFSTAT